MTTQANDLAPGPGDATHHPDGTGLLDVSIVIPAYREEGAIGDVVRAVRKELARQVLTWEVLVVDDGSGDRTGDLAREAGAQVIVHPYNKGYGAGLKTGIRAARGHTVVFMDADGQHRPEDIGRLLAARGDYQAVVGARKRSEGSPLWRKPGKMFLAWVVDRLVGRHIPDFNSGLRAIDRRIALRTLPLMPDGFSFSTTSTIAFFRAGYNVNYIPIQVRPRIGTSTVTVADGFRTLMLIIRLMTLFAPLRIFLPIAAVTLLVGVYFIGHGYATIGEASTKGILVMLASLHFFLFGILVDQVAALRRGEALSDEA